MTTLAETLAVLSAMITPAVLIAACSSLILATSQRLGRVIERTRRIADQVEKLHKVEAGHKEEMQLALFAQLCRSARRARLLQRSLAVLYLALGAFVGTSVAIALITLTGGRQAWLPMTLGIAGTLLLFYASLVLIAESRFAIVAVNDEMDYITRLMKDRLPPDAVEERIRCLWRFRRPRNHRKTA